MNKYQTMDEFYKACGDAIRAKKNNAEQVERINIPEEILSLETAKLNIHYGDNAPEDTTKLWVKLAKKPSKVEILNGDNEMLDLDIADLNNIAGVKFNSEKVTNCAVINNEGIVKICVTNNNFGYFFNIGSNKPFIIMLPSEATCMGAPYYHYDEAFYPPSCFMIPVFDYNSKKCYKINITTEEVIFDGPSLPKKLNYISCASVGNKTYVFGGQDGESASNGIYVYNSENDTIETLTTTLPKGLYDYGCASVGSKIYIFGGYDGTSISNEIYVFNTENNSIENLTETKGIALPNANRGLCCASIDNYIYIFGGYDENVALDTIQVFNSTNNTIKTLSIPLPQGMYGMGCASIGGKIYLAGGTNSSAISRFNTPFDVEEGTLRLLNQNISNKFPIINASNLNVEIGVGMALLGNENNEGESVPFAIHNGSEWVEYD